MTKPITISLQIPFSQFTNKLYARYPSLKNSVQLVKSRSSVLINPLRGYTLPSEMVEEIQSLGFAPVRELSGDSFDWLREAKSIKRGVDEMDRVLGGS